MKNLYRLRTNKVIAGVCSGLGEYFGIDPVIIRIIWLILVFAYGVGVLAYIICWIAIPKEPLKKAPSVKAASAKPNKKSKK